MQVLIVPSWYRRKEEGVGGVVFRNYARMYREQGIDSRLFYPMLDPFVRRKKLPEAWRCCYMVKEKDGVECVRYHSAAPPKRSGLFVRFWLRQSAKAFEAYLKEYGTPDLIHAHSYLAGLQAMRWKEKFGIPYAVTEHSTAFVRRRIPKWLKPSLNVVYKNATFVTCVSKLLHKGILEETGMDSLVVPNPVDTELFQTGVRTGEGDRPIRILACGAKIRHKGLDVLLEALSRIGSEERLAFHCQIADKPRRPEKLAHMISALKLEGRVLLCGELSREEMARKMRRCDLFVSASRYETFGNCMLEALCSGTPLVYTRTGAVELIGEDCGIAVEPRDAKALGKAIEQMIGEHQKYDPAELRASVVDKVSFERVGATFKGLIDQI